MVSIAALWLPILLSGVAVFVVSSIIHLLIPLQKGDYQKVAGEEEMRATMRTHGVKPGQYMFPCADSMKDCATPEHVAKLNEGPVGTLVVIQNGPVNMGKMLGIWFAFSVVVSVFVAYLTGVTTAPGTEFIEVFRRAGTVAFIAYGLSNVTDSIWKGVSWGITAKFLFDGLLYALATGALFAAMWPAAA